MATSFATLDRSASRGWKAALCLWLALAGNTGYAAADDPSLFEFDAFGTLGFVHSSESQADFTRNILVPNGAGASARWSAKVDSVLAGQLTTHFTRQLSAVVQVVIENRHDDSHRPRIEWANLRYEITPELAVGAGRIAAPIFMLTDTRRVAYALPWARPPMEVYDLSPITSSDGVNAIWRSRIGETTHTLEVAYGRSDAPYTRQDNSGTALARRQLILRSTLAHDATSFHIGFSPARLSVPQYRQLIDAFRQFGAQGGIIAERYDAENRETRYFGLGITHDPGKWFVMGEWARITVDGLIASRIGHYVSTGLRIGKVTPYVSWADTDPTGRRTDPGLDLTEVQPESRALASALNEQLSLRLGDVPSQTTLSAGVRWDFAPGFDLKVQYDHTDLAAGNSGMLDNFQPGFVPGGKVNLLGVSVSFVR